MQFKLTLRCLDEHPVLPINYQYELSAWIYKVIQHADAEYAAFLHHHGHTSGRKNFKLFCFSQLNVPRRHSEGDRLHIDCREVSFLIGFYLDRTAEEFVRGLFQQQEFRLGDRHSQVRFVVDLVEILPVSLPTDNRPVRIRLRSPLVVGRKKANGNDDYLHPDDPDFAPLFWENLLSKYRAATGQETPSWWDVSRFRLQVVGQEPKSKLVTIKVDTPAQTKVKGYVFDFEVDAPRELVEVGILAGFGRMNGEGFGFGEVVCLNKKATLQSTVPNTRYPPQGVGL